MEINSFPHTVDRITGRITVNMAVVNLFDIISVEHLENLGAVPAPINRRIMEKDDRLSAQLSPLLQRQPEPPALPVQYLFIGLVVHPAARSAQDIIPVAVSIIEQDMEGGKIIFGKEPLDLCFS